MYERISIVLTWGVVASFSVYPTPVWNHASECRHVVIRTLPLRNVFFGKAIFTWHPDLLEWVLGEFARVRRCFVLHRVFVGEGRGRVGNTGLFPVMLLWR